MKSWRSVLPIVPRDLCKWISRLDAVFDTSVFSVFRVLLLTTNNFSTNSMNWMAISICMALQWKAETNTHKQTIRNQLSPTYGHLTVCSPPVPKYGIWWKPSRKVWKMLSASTESTSNATETGNAWITSLCTKTISNNNSNTNCSTCVGTSSDNQSIPLAIIPFFKISSKFLVLWEIYFFSTVSSSSVNRCREVYDGSRPL